MEITNANNNHATCSARRLVHSAWAGIFVFGIVMAVPGAILPSLFARIQFSKSEAGNLFFYMNLAMLIMSMFFGPVVDRFGYKLFLLICSLLVAASFLFFTLAASYALLVAAALLLGFGGGGLNGGANALTSDLNPERRSAALNFLGIFFGFGALTIPFLIGALLDYLGLNRILIIAIILSLVPFAFFLLLRFPRAKQAQGFPLRQAAKVVGHPLLWLCGFLLFFQSGNEFTIGGWTSTYLTEYFSLTPRLASFVLAGYWGAVMIGRLISTRLVRRMKNGTLILGSALISLAAAGLMAFGPTPAFASLGAVLVGLGFAAIYPTTLAVVGEAFPAFSGTAFSFVFVLGLAGGMTAPWLTGRVAGASGIRSGFIVPVVCCAMIVLLQLVINKRGQVSTIHK